MKQIVEKYARKLVDAGFADKDAPLVGGIDADVVWNREDPLRGELEKVLTGLNINSILFSKPAEPYCSILNYLAEENPQTIYPNDCETRTFMHDLPVIESFDAEEIIRTLKQRKSVIVKNAGIITWGTVSPEQAFIFFSSACFAGFVKFFSDYLTVSRKGTVTHKQKTVFEHVRKQLDPLPEKTPVLMQGPFKSEDEVIRAISEAGRLTVEYRLVDSFFGNVSLRRGDTLYISQTGSSLDELENCIDPCPLDGSSCASITASSEYTAHSEVVLKAGVNGILHGHPKFAVIISMDCEKEDCPHVGECHIKCRERRLFEDIPIVPGEVGTGPFGLCNTLPPAIVGRRGVMVYGHGLFTVAGNDFNDAFANLMDIERRCREAYFARVDQP